MIPSGLVEAIDAALEAGGPIAAEAARLHARYRAGGDSAYGGERGALAYAAGRMPATAAAVACALDAAELPACRSLLDLGAGTGAAAWAAHERFALGHSTLIERDPDARDVGQRLAPFAASWLDGDLAHGLWPQHELVIAAYSLGELAAADLPGAIAAAWSATARVLVVVEPGTPAGAAVIERVRQHGLAEGAWIAAPCTHHASCPLTGGGGWCHRAVRVPRARFQRHAKGGSRNFEDEKFCYLVATREALPRPDARIVASPRAHKAAVELSLCTAAGLVERSIPRRQPAYKWARKLDWGDAFGFDQGGIADRGA